MKSFRPTDSKCFARLESEIIIGQIRQIRVKNSGNGVQDHRGEFRLWSSSWRLDESAVHKALQHLERRIIPHTLHPNRMSTEL